MKVKATSKMNEHLRKLCAASVAVTLAATLMLTGCSGATTSTASNTGNTNGAAVTTQASSSTVTTTGAKDIDLSALDLEYTDRDKNASYDESAAVKITLSGNTASVSGSSSGVKIDGSTVTISAEGVYVLSGTLNDGQIVVDCNAEDKAKVQVVLNGVTITNNDGPAFYVKQAKKVFLTLADGSTNSLSDGSSYALENGSDEPYACIFSKDDLTLQGSGTLNVTANYRHAICSKDDLVITGGTYNVTAAEDALRGRDCVKICGGTFNLNSGQDAVKSNNDEDATAGYITIDGGTFNVEAGDDAFHAETALIINGGTISVSKSYEGLEGQQIYINGGDTSIVASDDGVNAAIGSNSDAQFADAGNNHKFDMSNADMSASGAPSTSDGGQAPADMPNGAQPPSGFAPDASAAQPSDASDDQSAGKQAGGRGQGGFQITSSEDAAKIFLKVSGGTLKVDSQGDGLDSNGSIEITGGTVMVNGPSSQGDGALDYETTCQISGGTLIAIGSSGMAEGFTGGTQAFGMANASGSAGSTVQAKDASGNVVATITATKSFSSVVVSAPSFASGSTCTVDVDGTAVELTPSTEATSNGYGVAGFGGQGFSGMQQRQQR